MVQHLPIAVVAAQLGGDVVGFGEYIRYLDRNIAVCAGTEPEWIAARDTIVSHRAGGAVLDTYTAWTAATMSILDILATVFGKLVVPQSVMDELRNLRDEEKVLEGPSMTLAWQNNRFVRQEHTKEDVAERRRFIDELIQRIAEFCKVEPVSPRRPGGGRKNAH